MLTLFPPTPKVPSSPLETALMRGVSFRVVVVLEDELRAELTADWI
jgi:hypothetical protein